MQLMVSRSYPAIDAETLTEYSAREALFRCDDGSFLLYMNSERQRASEERILKLDCREALIWLNATTEAVGSYWHFAEMENQGYHLLHASSDVRLPLVIC